MDTWGDHFDTDLYNCCYTRRVERYIFSRIFFLVIFVINSNNCNRLCKESMVSALWRKCLLLVRIWIDYSLTKFRIIWRRMLCSFTVALTYSRQALLLLLLIFALMYISVHWSANFIFQDASLGNRWFQMRDFFFFLRQSWVLLEAIRTSRHSVKKQKVAEGTFSVVVPPIAMRHN